MTTITLQVPDELAKQLDPLRANLPALLAKAIELDALDRRTISAFTAQKHPLLDEMVDLLASTPTPREIVAFKFSPQAQARLQDLVEKNREEPLDADESAELEIYSQIHHLMILLKARARQTFAHSN